MVSDPGPFSGVPDGAMVEAQNVIFRRPGVVEPRAPLAFTRDASATGSCYGAFAFDDGSSVTPQWIGSSGWRASGTTTVSGGFTFSQYKTRHSSYRGRGFFTADQGIAVLDGASDTSARLAGVPRGPAFHGYLTTGTGAWLSADYIIGYRTCLVRTLNGVPTRGAPSEVKQLACSSYQFSSAATYPTIRIYITPDIVAGDTIEVYRLSKVLGVLTSSYYTVGTPADEGRLRNVFLVTASDVSTGYIDFVDFLPDGNWDGPYLYTNASQDGILLANERPNYCIDVATYNRMHFFGGQRSPQRVTLQINGTGIPEDLGAPPPFTNTTDYARRLCGFVTTGGIVSGSNQITLTTAADAGFVVVGMRVTDGTGSGTNPELGTANLPQNVYVTASNPNTGIVTLSANATGTSAGAYLRFYDWLEVDDGTTKRKIYTCYGYSYPEPVAGIQTSFTKFFVGTSQWHEVVSGGPPTYCFAGGSGDIERAWAASYSTASFRVAAVASGTKSNESITIRIERTDASLGAFTVRSSKPLAFDQYVDSVTGVTSSQEGTPGRLAWSKLDEPESAPLPYYADIGDPNLPIYRIMAVQDALYVFKADGIWRVFGDDPQNLVIQQVDATARMTQGMSGAVARYGNNLYAWTQKGIVECSGLGVRNIDGAIYNQANAPLGSSPDLNNSGWACAHWYGRWIAFCSGANGAPAYVYHPEMGTWATWTFKDYVWAASTPIGGTYSTNNAPILGVTRGFAQANVSWPTPETATFATVLCGGDLYPVTITGVVGTRVTINSATLWVPAVGDALVTNGSGPYYVTNVVICTSIDVDRTGCSVVSTSAYSAYDAKVTWTASATNNVASEKHYTDSMFLFSRMMNGRYFTERYQGYKNNTEGTHTANYDPTGAKFAAVKPYVRRSHVPVSVSRDWALKLGFTFTQGCTFWTLDGAALSFSDAGTRL